MGINVVWTADAKMAIREAEKVTRAAERTEAEYRRLSGTSTKAADIQARVGKAAIKSAKEAEQAIIEGEARKAEAMAKIAALKGQERAQADQAIAKAREQGEATRKQEREQERLAEAVKRTYREGRPPQERYAAKMRELNALVKAGKITQDEYKDAAKRAADEAAQGGEAQLDVGGKVLSQLGMIAGALGVGTGIAGAVALMKQGFQNSLEVMREITSEAMKASEEIIAFAALQEKGTKGERAEAAMEMGAQFGVPRGQAWSTVQAMQSMLGDFDAGMNEARDIFAASLAGIPVDLGKELEIRGIAAGMKPGEAVRDAFVAGELSGRTPAELPKAAEALPYWKGEETLMFAVAGELAASAGDQLSTYMKRLGQALSPVSGLADWYKEQGIPEEATQGERLEAISKAGINSQTLLAQAGVTEKREMLALLNALNRYEQIVANVKTIPQLATPELFAAKRAGVEEEIPMTKEAREVKVIAEGTKNALVLNERTVQEQKRDREWIEVGSALKRAGIDTFAGMRTYTTETRDEVEVTMATAVGRAAAAFESVFGLVPSGTAGVGRPAGEVNRKRAEIRAEVQAAELNPEAERSRPGGYVAPDPAARERALRERLAVEAEAARAMREKAEAKKEQEEAEKKVAEDVRKVREQTRTPGEIHAQKLQELQQLPIDAETRRRAVEQANEALQKASESEAKKLGRTHTPGFGQMALGMGVRMSRKDLASVEPQGLQGPQTPAMPQSPTAPLGDSFARAGNTQMTAAQTNAAAATKISQSVDEFGRFVQEIKQQVSPANTAPPRPLNTVGLGRAR